MRERDETFLYAGYMFDATLARRLAQHYSSWEIPSHRSVSTGRVALAPSYDLSDPVVFGTWKRGDELGCLLVDGNHRMQYAAKHRLPLAAVFLTLYDSYLVLGSWHPQWTPRIWRKLHATARFYGLQFVAAPGT